LADAIAYAKEGRYRYTVGGENRMSSYAGGKPIPLPDLASLHETGFPVVVRKTLRMVAYLRILYERSWAPPPKRHLDDITIGSMVLNVPARPIWGDTWRRFVPEAKRRMDAMVDRIWMK